MNCEVNIRTAAINTAREYRVPFILYGSSQIESTGSHAFLGARAMLRRIPIRSVLRFAFHMVHYSLLSVRQRIEMGVPLRYRFLPRGGVRFPDREPTVVHFFKYVAWDSLDKVAFLQEQLGWRAPADQEQRFDCALHCLGNYKWIQDSGVSSDGYTYSSMIREGHIAREEVLRKESLIQVRLDEECGKLLQEVGLDDFQLPGN